MSFGPTAAESLVGLTVGSGWTIEEKLRRQAGATGGVFSVGYIATKEGEKAFLKALDFSPALQAPNVTRVLQAMTAAFIFEADLLALCRQKRLDRVALALEEGTVHVSGFGDTSNVPFLIFELADGDVRKHMSVSANIETAWLLRCLHNVATGVFQLHGQGIAHQDLKPSNVLVFSETESRVGDLGRATQKGVPAAHDQFPVAGDRGYAPPELLYGDQPPDFARRRLACDLYLLGSLVVFFFTGANLTAATLSKMAPSHHWRVWGDGFAKALPHIRDAFERVLADFELGIAARDKALAPELVQLVRHLANPDPTLRGHPKYRMAAGHQYRLDYFVSRFDSLATKAEIALKAKVR